MLIGLLLILSLLWGELDSLAVEQRRPRDQRPHRITDIGTSQDGYREGLPGSIPTDSSMLGSRYRGKTT